MRFHDHNRGAALVFITGCLWGSIGLFIRLMSDAGASVAAISFLRMAFAFIILAIVTVARSGISAFRVSGRTLLFSAALLILAIFPGIAYWAANLLGFMSPINFVYVVIIFLLLAKQFFMSIRLSQLDSKVRILTEQVALNEEKVEREKLDL